MIFPGDYKFKSWVRHFYWKRIFGEIYAGLKSNIPLCCVVYYSVVFRFHLVFKTVKILDFFYPDSWDFFSKEDYHRCFLCYLCGRKVKVDWNGINEYRYIN